MSISKITPFLWFDGRAQEAAEFYVAIFKNSKITKTSYYGEAGQETHGQPAGRVMAVEFELDGHRFSGLNGGPAFTFSPAISFQVNCADQAEVDHFWESLGAGGDAAKQQCGWLQDKFGLSWQVVPAALPRLMSSSDKDRVKRVTKAMMQMKKLDVAGLQAAYDG